MDDVNLSFLVYFLGPSSAEEVRERIEKLLKLSLHPERADASEEETVGSFEGESLGLYVSLHRAEIWSDEAVYRLGGSTHPRIYSPNVAKVLINGHIAKVLAQGGMPRVMTPAEYTAAKKQRSSP